MSIDLKPELAKLVQDKVERGEYPDVHAVLEAAIRSLDAEPRLEEMLPTPEERLANLEQFFGEVEADPPPRKTTLPDEALDRETLYDDRV